MNDPLTILAGEIVSSIITSTSVAHRDMGSKGEFTSRDEIYRVGMRRMKELTGVSHDDSNPTVRVNGYEHLFALEDDERTTLTDRFDGKEEAEFQQHDEEDMYTTLELKGLIYCSRAEKVNSRPVVWFTLTDFGQSVRDLIVHRKIVWSK